MLSRGEGIWGGLPIDFDMLNHWARLLDIFIPSQGFL